MNQVWKRFLTFMLVLCMVISVVPFHAMAVEMLNTTVLDGKIAVTSDGVSGQGTGVVNNDGTITVTSTATSSCSGFGNYSYTANAHEIYVTNNTTDETLMVDFAYDATGLGTLVIDGVTKTSTPNGRGSKSLAPGERITIVITSPATGSGSTGATTTIVLSDFQLKDTSTKKVTVAKTDGGTVTVNGTTLTAASIDVETDYATGVPVTAKAASGYVFVGWVDSNMKVLSTLSSYTIQPLEDMTVGAAFVPNDTQGYWLAGDALHTDLNEACAAAQNGDKTVILLKSATLPAGTYTIPAGISVLIPFDEAKTSYGAEPEVVVQNQTWYTPSAYMTLTLASGAKLNVNGSLELAAKHYCSAGPDTNLWGGAIYQKFGHINMVSGSEINVNNGGTLYAWGVVSGAGQVTANSGATIHEKMQVHDYRGGTATSSLATTYSGRKLFPFSQYYVQNVEVKEIIHAGATLMVNVGVYLSTPEQASVAFVGPSGAMFTVADGGYVTKQYDAATDRLKLEAFGNTSLSSISLSFEGQSVNSANFRLGINNNIDIHVRSGVTTISQDVVLQAGATVTVDREATVYNTANLFVMDAEDWGTFARGKTLIPVKWSYANGTTVKRTSVTDAIVDINGTIINGGQIFSTGNESIISSEKTGVYALLTPANGSDTLNQLDHNSFTLGMTSDWVQIACTAAVLVHGDKTTLTAEGAQYDAYIYDSLLDKWVQKNIYNGGTGYVATLTYNANGGTGNVAAHPVDYFANAAGFMQTQTLAPFSFAVSGGEGLSKDKYVFTGWNTAADGSGKSFASGDYITISADSILYAQWQLAEAVVSFDANGGTGTMNAMDVELENGKKTITIPACTFTKEGYRLAGWNTQADGSGTAYAAGASVTVSADMTLYAQWVKATAAITFVANAPEGTAAEGTMTSVTVQLDEDGNSEFEVPVCGYTVEGYTFDGWLDADRNGYVVGQTYTVTGDLTLYAQWVKDSAVISFNANAPQGTTPSGAMADQIVNEGDKLNTNAFVVTGYTFKGWNTASDGSGTAYADGAVAPAESITLYAQWEINTYTITWSIDGKTETTTVVHGQVPTHADPTKAETAEYTYKFTGWTPTVMAATGDASYTAQFKATAKSYTITYVVDGTAVHTDTFAFGAAVTAWNYTASEGYNFSGWDAEIPATMPAKNVTISGTTSIKTYTITWIIDGKTETTTVNHGQVPTHADPTKAETAEYTYKFTGWTPAVVAATGDAEYTAQFKATAKSYTITYVVDGKEVHTDTFAFGAAVTAWNYTASEGYNFSGWDAEIPATMPAKNVTISGTTSIKTYTITWIIDGKSETTTVNHGQVPTHAAPTKAETAEYTYEFTGWTPAVVAATGDASYTAQFKATAKSYTITYVVDGTAVHTDTFAFGAAVTAWNYTAPEGYNFSGWDAEIPATMPAKNVTISGTTSIKTYTITWIIDGKTETTTVNHGQVPTHADPTKAETAEYTYEFTGWTPAVEAATGNTTYTAQFEATAKSYTITYVVDGTAVHTDTFAFGAAVTAWNYTAAEGYNFSGWDAEIPATMPAKNVTISGTTSIKAYTVSFDTDGDGDIDVSKTVAHGDVPEAPAFSKADTAEWDYTFTGWRDSDGNVYTTLPAASGAETYTAVYEAEKQVYTITWVIDGKSEETFVAYGEMPTHADPTKAETLKYTYEFTGWTPALTAVTGDATYTAQFEENLRFYKITFDFNGGIEKNSGKPTSTSSYFYEESIPLFAYADYASREGYTLVGWNSEADGSGTDYGMNFMSMPAHEVTIYAQWKINEYTITWIIDGKSETTTVNHGDLPTYADPSKDADAQYTYTFAGWSPNVVAATGDATYTATFTPVLRSYDITFVVDGQENKVVSTKYGELPVYDADGKLPEKAADAYYSYEFAGWTPTLETVTGEATYTATWTETPVTHTIIFKEGDEVLAVISGNYGDAVDMTKVPATDRTGYTFNGWSMEIPTTMPAGNTVITGSWTVNQYTITFKQDPDFDLDDNFAYSITKNYGEAITDEDLAALNAALGTYYGYEFQYWETEDEEYTIPATMPAYDQEVTAYWEGKPSELKVYSSLNPDQQLGNMAWMKYDEVYATVEDFNTVNLFNFTDPNGSEYLTPEGYVFTGYKFADGTDMVFPYTHKLLEDVSIYAQFAPIDYTVIFMNGDSEYAKVTTGFGTTITLPENPVKEGSTFAGWVNAEGNAVELTTMPLNGMTVYASWTVDTFKLNFFASEGDTTAYKTFDVTYGTELTAEYVAQLLAQITDPTKEGNTWNGWSIDALPETMPASAVNVYGDWTVNTYRIYWSVVDIWSGTVVETIEQSYLYGAATAFPEYTAPEGYVIIGAERAPETMPAEDLYRQISLDTKAYTITFDTDGGSAVESITAHYKSEITAPAAPTKTGHIFLGWSVDGETVIEFPETMPLNGLNLKALWAPATVYITWIIEGVETVEDYAYGAAIVAPEATKASDAKWTYKFTCWDAEIPATATENATFTAQFAEDEAVKYNVKFVDGENTVFETQIAWNDVVTLDGFTAPEMIGNTLAWTVDGAAASFPYAMTTADVTFVAAWTPITYTVYYYTVDGFDNNEGPVHTAQATYGAAFPTYELTVSEGYYFGYWATPNGMTYEFPETMPAENLHLIGYVYPDSFNVQFKNGDDLVWNDFVEFNTSIYDALGEHIEAPEAAAGYTFAGWYDADGVKLDENYVMPAHAVVFTAKWTYTGWMEETDGTTYLVNDEKVYFSEWAEIDGATYYFDANSYILKDIALLDDVYYAFDHETGAFLGDYTGIYEALNGDKYYVENGVAVKNKGLVKDVLSDGHIHYYYFGCADATCTDEACAGEYKAQRNCGHWAEITNGYLVLWGYQFDENGVIIHDEDTSKNGVHLDNGVKYYYIDGVKVHYGLFIGDDGEYYYAKSDGSLVTNREYWISASHINGLTYKGEAIVEGSYTFDEEGRIVWPSTEKNGVYIEDSKLYYYEAGLRTYAGLIRYTGKLYNEKGDVIGSYNNDIIYVRGSGELAVGKYWPTKTNGLMESDTYQFDKSGKMMMLNGIIAEEGSLYYYKDGLRNYAGLIEIDGSLYYVRGTGEVVHGRSYWITKTNGMMDEGKFDFAADGKMIIPEPVAQKNGVYREDGKLMYYVDGKLNYAGLIQYTGDLIEEDGTVIKGVYQNAYIYVRGTGELVFGRSYWTTKHNDHMKAASYQFDDNGIMLNPAV